MEKYMKTNMKIKQFIEKAIEGGWRHLYHPENILLSKNWEEEVLNDMVLDPLAWKAVMGDKLVKIDEENVGEDFYETVVMVKWKWHMHQMIDVLAEGKSIEEFIKTL